MPGEGELHSLQAVWDEHGRVDALWAVLSNEGHRGRQWDLADFFANGAAYADFVMHLLADAGAAPTPGRCLDFGCGPGRVTQGLCRHFEEVDGVDIAPSMIELANRYNQFGDRCRYHINARPDLSLFDDGTFDCVHSVLVLQHIDPPHALSYVREFVRVLAAGGIAVFQAPSHRREPVPAIPLGDGAFRAHLRFAADPPDEVGAGEQFSVAVAVRNDGDEWWPAFVEGPGPFHVRIGNHWLNRRGRPVAFDDGRSPLTRDCPPGDEQVHNLVVTAPPRRGRYTLEVDVLQEHVTWFAERGSPTLRAHVKVRRAGATDQGASAADTPEQAPPTFAMHPLPRDAVVDAVTSVGGEVLAVCDDFFSGPDWVSHTYVVRKD